MSARAKSPAAAMRTHRIEVDWTRCDGHGLCAALLPEHITRDEWGFPIISAASISEADARRVVAACPALALRLPQKEPVR